ncbi:hypothetical protein AAFC00_001602 [Neodothiora populina]|uniref:Cellobiose dehydrogenase n=1 Tax=Neodothiora populina TaxID=2781224 RepID=A0ABR3PPH4_9PEZI
MCYYNAPNSSVYYCGNLPEGQLAACRLGGGTAINAMQQFWPPTQYLDHAYGFEGWSSEDFQPAIHRVATRIPPTPYWSSDNKFYYDQVYSLMGSVLETAGLKEVNTSQDVDEKYNTYGRDVYAAADGLRGGPLVGYLQDARKLPNFTLKMYSHVDYVVRDGSKATGVSVNGTVITADAVVLSAGVWNTPSILFASGIGPESELTTAASIGFTNYPKSEWIFNERVGKNLHDNPQTNYIITYNDTDALPAFYDSEIFYGYNVSKTYKDDLYLNHAGPLTGTGRQLVTWITVEDSGVEMTCQAICSTPTTTNGTFNCQFNLNEGLLSRGSIGLGTDGNLVFKEGVGPWLTNSTDVKMYALGLQRFVDAITSYPGLSTSTVPIGDLASYEAHLKANKAGNNHWGGSCKIGDTDGTKGGEGCVDLTAKVYGTDNLYVIDGSLSPAPTTSNPSFLYEVLAEFAVEKIVPVLRRR